MRKNYLLNFAMLLSVALTCFACGGTNNEPEPGPNPEQNPLAQLFVDKEEFEFGYKGETKSMNITGNVEWSIEVESGDSEWLEINPAEGKGTKKIEFTAAANEVEEAREVSLILKALETDDADGEENIPAIKIKVSQEAGKIEIDGSKAIEFVDAKFKEALLEVATGDMSNDNYSGHLPQQIDANGDGEISIDEAKNVVQIGVKEKGIESIEELANFPNIEKLFCEGNALTSLDLSANKYLTRLSCSENKLTELNVDNCSQLLLIDCGENELSNINLADNMQLVEFWGIDNKFTEIDFSKCYNLRGVDLDKNKLTKLDFSSNPLVAYIYCQYNQLTELNTSNLSDLQVLLCMANKLTTMDMSSNGRLMQFWCHYNDLESINLENCEALTSFDCASNELTTIDFSDCPAIEYLCCGYNNIESLDVSEVYGLKRLYCHGNVMTALNVTENASLTNVYCGCQKDSDGAEQAITLTISTAQDLKGVFDSEDGFNKGVTLEVI